MEAMQYEYLLRNVYKSERDFSNGADADIYRRMDVAHRNLETKTLYATDEEREHNFRSKFVAVRMNVEKAISTGIKEVSDLTNEEIEQLEEMKILLNWDLFDKEQLDKIIISAGKILNKKMAK